MRRQLVWTLLVVLATFGIASAQETTTGSITGTVVDAQGAPVPGATVTVASPQGPKAFVTDANGKFFAPYLTPGRYSVRVELAGFSPVEQKNIDVHLGQRLELANVALKVGGVQEVVEVVGGAPTVDTSSTTAGGVLDSDTLARLPVGRNFTDTLYLVPGVSDSSGLGRANPSVAGASGLENNYVVDGVNITDTGFGAIGAYNSTYGSLGSGVTTDFIKETQVKTGGFEAEYGQATGGVINVVTKSGGNDFHGSVFGYFRPDALESSYKTFQAQNGIVNTTGRQEYDFGVSLGGPLIRDKMFFFGAFNPQVQNRSFVAPDPSTLSNGSVVNFPFKSLGDVTRKRKIYSYAGKLTFQASANHRFDLSIFGDPSKGDSGLQNFNGLRRVAYPGVPGTTAIDGGYSSIDYGSNNQTLRYDGIISPNWLIEGSVGHSTNKFDETPAVADQPLYTDTRFVPNGASGGLGFYENNNGRNYQASLKSTNIFEAGGNHQVRYGVAYEDISFTRDTEYSGNPVKLADGRTTLTGTPVQIRTGGGVTYYRATRGKISPAAPTLQKYYNAFLQDTWQVGHLTIRPGIRWERQHLQGIDPSLMAFPCHADDPRPGETTGTGAKIPCTYTWSNLWAPRVGATYDIKGNGKSKLYASWGRFYAKIPNDLAARAMSADAGITRQDFFDAALTQPIANGVSYGGTTTHFLVSSAAPSIIDPKAGSTYSDEAMGGVEFEVGRNVSLGLRYVHRTLPQILEDIGQLPVVGYFLDQCGDTTVDYFITNVNHATPTVNCGTSSLNSSFEDPAHKYDAFEFTINKNFSNNWGLIASYRYAKLKGNFEGFYRSDNGQSDPSISSLFDFPTNDPSYTAIGVPQFGFGGDIRFQGTTLGQGVLPNDRPHQVKIYGSYSWGALNLGIGYNWGSGRSLTLLDSNPVYANAGEIPDALRGSGFTTSDGFKTRTAPDSQLDAHVDYTIKLNTKQHVVLLADAFNVFNRQAALNYDNFRDRGFQVANPNVGLPLNGGGSATTGYQAPLAIRLGARFEW